MSRGVGTIRPPGGRVQSERPSQAGAPQPKPTVTYRRKKFCQRVSGMTPVFPRRLCTQTDAPKDRDERKRRLAAPSGNAQSRRGNGDSSGQSR